MADSAAALLDERLRPPRQGDSDEGRALLLDPPAPNSWPPMLALAGALVGRLDWWPRPPADAASVLVGALAGAKRQLEGRPAPAAVAVRRRRDHAAAHARHRGARDLVPLRRRPARVPQHRRARPRRRPVRRGPVRGRGHPRRPRHLLLPRRARSGGPTSGRRSRTTPPNSAAGASPAEGGPFMWVRHARSREIEVIDDGDIARWTAEHDGYATLDPPALHRRSVLLDRASRSIDIIDEIEGGEPRAAPRLPPRSRGAGGARRVLTPCCAGPPRLHPGAARLELPPGLAVEPAPGRDRSHPRLVLSRPGSSDPRFHPARLRALRARRAPGHPAGVPRNRRSVEDVRLPAGRIMVRIRRRIGVGDPSGDQMSQR